MIVPAASGAAARRRSTAGDWLSFGHGNQGHRRPGPERPRRRAGPQEDGRTPAGQKVQSQRYTPPVPKNVKTSSRWLGIVILALFALGVLIVILNYAGLLPGGVNNLWLVAAIGSIFAGLILATRYH